MNKYQSFVKMKLIETVKLDSKCTFHTTRHII